MQPIILAHRGYWNVPEEKNTPGAFDRAFSEGFGVETDFRDCCGELVVSHDPPGRDAMPAKAFFELYRARGGDLPLAVNVKADGLQKLLKNMLEEYQVKNYFLFDMSAPDALISSRRGLRFFSRHSEIEPSPYLYDTAAGVWMDCFEREWMTAADVTRHRAAGKDVCLVSPELHGRPHEAFWRKLAEMKLPAGPAVMLCTDHPGKARVFFGHE